jgi:protease IV
MSNQTPTQKVEITPKLNNFFWLYLLNSIPKILISILVILLILLILISFIVGASIDSATSENLVFKKIEDNKSQNNVLVYNLNGAIQSGRNSEISSNSGIFLDDVKEDFVKIGNDASIKNIVFKFNSPGGEVFASEELGDEITNLLKKKNIKEGIFYFDSIAASGALFASYKVPNNYIFASKYGETGSIGVRLEIPNITKLADNVGYKQIVIKSGNSKDIGSPFREPTSEEYAYIQGQINQVYNRFVDIVATGRESTKEQILPIANGYTYFNDKAKDLKLVDELSENINSAIKKAGSNLENYNVIEIEKPKSFLESLGVKYGINNNFYLSPTANITNSVNTKIKKGVFYAIDERFISE